MEHVHLLYNDKLHPTFVTSTRKPCRREHPNQRKKCTPFKKNVVFNIDLDINIHVSQHTNSIQKRVF